MSEAEGLRFLLFTLVALAVLLWYIPRSSCKECNHCKAESLRAKEAKAKLKADIERSYHERWHAPDMAHRECEWCKTEAGNASFPASSKKKEK